MPGILSISVIHTLCAGGPGLFQNNYINDRFELHFTPGLLQLSPLTCAPLLMDADVSPFAGEVGTHG